MPQKLSLSSVRQLSEEAGESILKASALLAVIALSIPAVSMAHELDVKSLTIKGVTGLKAADILVNRPIEPKATYNVVAIGKGPEGSVVSINTRYSDASGWVYSIPPVDLEGDVIGTRSP